MVLILIDLPFSLLSYDVAKFRPFADFRRLVANDVDADGVFAAAAAAAAASASASAASHAGGGGSSSGGVEGRFSIIDRSRSRLWQR